jgi:hypothetical protein
MILENCQEAVTRNGGRSADHSVSCLNRTVQDLL